MTGTPKLGDARVVAEIVTRDAVYNMMAGAGMPLPAGRLRFHAELYREVGGVPRWERAYGAYNTPEEAATVARNLSEEYKVSLRYDKIRNAIEENGPVTVYEYENGELGGEHWFL